MEWPHRKRLIGLLFRGKRGRVDNTELVICIVPHLAYRREAWPDTPARRERPYRHLVKRTLG